MIAKRICVDFNGVIYPDEHTTVEDIVNGVFPQGPIEGAFDFLIQLVDADYDVIIFSTLCGKRSRIQGINFWMNEHGLPVHIRKKLGFSNQKPPNTHLYIDDRGWRFEGTFPSVDEIEKTNRGIEMIRRSFLKKLGLGSVSIPFLGNLSFAKEKIFDDEPPFKLEEEVYFIKDSYYGFHPKFEAGGYYFSIIGPVKVCNIQTTIRKFVRTNDRHVDHQYYFEEGQSSWVFSSREEAENFLKETNKKLA